MKKRRDGFISVLALDESRMEILYGRQWRKLYKKYKKGGKSGWKTKILMLMSGMKTG